ncbi:MAG TPA: hypothetical protein PK684_06890 [Bacillota bacterium]|jgi:hypothetical protein|nr:hypothetical protein [Bacillota bacterium]
MKHIKFYNVIFPIWFLMFFPPVVLLTLAGNFIIGSQAVAGCFDGRPTGFEAVLEREIREKV